MALNQWPHSQRFGSPLRMIMKLTCPASGSPRNIDWKELNPKRLTEAADDSFQEVCWNQVGHFTSGLLRTVINCQYWWESILFNRFILPTQQRLTCMSILLSSPLQAICFIFRSETSLKLSIGRGSFLGMLAGPVDTFNFKRQNCVADQRRHQTSWFHRPNSYLVFQHKTNQFVRCCVEMSSWKR